MDCSPVDSFYENLPQYKDKLEELLNPEKKRRGRKRKNKMYFTPITEKAIIYYNIEKSIAKRNKIYNEYIHYPLWKLSQNIINRFKFPYMFGSTEDKQYEVIAFILQKLDKYTEDKGKAFSYFSIVAKNYCIQTNNKAYLKFKSKIDLTAVDKARDVINEISKQDMLDDLSAFMDLFVDHYELRIEKLYPNQGDKCIAYAIMDMFRRRANIEKYNKKALYLMIREVTNESTKNISRILSEVKKEYKEKYILYGKN